ncbi:putative reverse transcriptase zinc-binding domain-containing protein [Helianthus annuus]|nr:putative reverse transcriptase zinc-binding domain-containing protein [Helianthus annuus]
MNENGQRVVYRWNKWIPSNVSDFGWKVSHGRIPSKDALRARGINLPSIVCSRCGIGTESMNHILFRCQLSKWIWWQVLVWLKLPLSFMPSSFHELVLVVENAIGSKMWKKLIEAIVLVTMWGIWKARNEIEFNKRHTSINRTMEQIKEHRVVIPGFSAASSWPAFLYFYIDDPPFKKKT